MKKLGLDLGSSTAGWALRENDKIIADGVITFQAGMMKGQTGGYTSPTKDRREARSKRRLIQARKYRKWELLKVLLEEFAPINKTELECWSKYKKGHLRKFPENPQFLKWLACDFTYQGGVKYNNPYELRVKALDEQLSKHEFGRALYHLVQRRGYKNIGEADEETKKQIERRGESGFKLAMENNRTVAEALTKQFLENGERARNQYPYREEYLEELEKICAAQCYDCSKNEKGEYKNEFVTKLKHAIIWQRPLRSQKGNIGKCTLEPSKPRCPVSHPIFEVFRALSFINTIKYADSNSKEKQFLSSEEREYLFENIFLKNDKNFKFEIIRKSLDKFTGKKNFYNYPYNKKDEIYDSSVAGMPVCKGLITIIGSIAHDAIATIYEYNIGNAPKILNRYSIYDLWHALFDFDEKFLLGFAVKELGIKNTINKTGEDKGNPFSKLKGLITSSYSDLSLKAMCKIIPFLKEGFLYNEAVVLAKMPELLGPEKWNAEKSKIIECVRKANQLYSHNKTIIGIANNLIDNYKALEDEVYAYKNFAYDLGNLHDNEIFKACIDYFGEKTWEKSQDKDAVFQEVKREFQAFMKDSKRTYRETPLFTDTLMELLRNSNIHFIGKLYHHSNRENLYLKKIRNFKTGEIKLPIDNKTKKELLPNPIIDSIKNPMFNKSMSILRKLINKLIIENKIDEDTEIVVELARELNDNNKRAAIERYQRNREDNRKRFRQFLTQYKEQVRKDINVEENISKFEMWTEQNFEKVKDEKGKDVSRNAQIHKEKKELKRYELWIEQKGQCMYTGKMISISQLFSSEIDIMHTIPRSLLPDNTMANQTVGFSRYNRDLQKQQLPKQCDNYYKDVEGWGTQIEARLDNWITVRDNWKELYESRLKPQGGEDEALKNKRIQEKHYFKMHFDYWQDKVSRFTADEVNKGWARRQLVDTQMVSKYAREFLKTYFKTVSVQKGSVTAEFRKMYGFQEQDEIKSRNRHTHHAIDAAVLTLIPSNSSLRERMLTRMYEIYESQGRQYTTVPYPGFSSQALINNIETTTLIVNYEKDNILKETSKIVRKRGRIQYVKNKKGEFVLDKEGNKIKKIAQGDTVRSPLYKDTFVGKIKDVERFEDGQPIRENGDWKYKQGKDEFAFVVRKSLKDVLGKVDDIVDPVIREIVRSQKENAVDPQGNKIRHVRIRTSAGQIVKERINYKSKHEHKNNYYAAAGSLPYAALLENSPSKKTDRILIPIASFEITKFDKQNGSFNVSEFIEAKYKRFKDYSGKKLLKIGQKIIVLNDDSEYEKRHNIDFLSKRLFRITQFKYDGSKIMLQFHLEAQSKGDIDEQIKSIKDAIVKQKEIELDIPLIEENELITDTVQRKKDYKKRVEDFSTRLKIIAQKSTQAESDSIRRQIEEFKTESSTLIEDKTPILGLTKNNWNFLYEGVDFKISLLGKIDWINEIDRLGNIKPYSQK